MSKVAIFVEGQTESELTLKLLEALCGKRGIAIELHQQRGGTLHFVSKAGDDQSQLFAMVANCSNDGQVKTQINDRYSTLVSAGFTRVIGIRDVYPDFVRTDLPKLEQAKMVGIPSAPLPVDLHYAVMEVEAWFLDEISHFERVHPGLTVTRIASDGFDIASQHGETWDHPAGTLNAIYKLEGLAWGKKGKHVRRTVDALCMESFYLSARARSASLSAYISSLEQALFPPSATSVPAPL